MFMGEVQTVKKFEAKIPIAIWRKWEQWLDDRGTLNNTQILVGLLRLFLSCPEDIQLKALFGREKDLGGLRRAQEEAGQAAGVLDHAKRSVQSPQSAPVEKKGKVA